MLQKPPLRRRSFYHLPAEKNQPPLEPPKEVHTGGLLESLEFLRGGAKRWRMLIGRRHLQRSGPPRTLGTTAVAMPLPRMSSS